MTSRSNAQESFYGSTFDYEPGSPHLRHRSLRSEIVEWIQALIDQAGPGCEVLEVGAGHGHFTGMMLAAGARVSVTEMSKHSVERLIGQFGDHPMFRCIYDPTGDRLQTDDATYDIAVCASVLHHIPDYLGFLSDSVVPKINVGGSLASFQDPLWYPRRPKTTRLATTMSYAGWRVTRGNYRQAIDTQLRRARRGLDPTNTADTVEYHVVRDGVDDERLETLLLDGFSAVTRWEYWSTQAPLLQRLGERLAMRNTFALVARGKRPTA